MNIVSIGVLAVVAVIVALTLRPKNAEIALMLTVACAVLILLAVLSQAGQIIGTVNSIVAAAQINTGYIAILLKVVGICLLTEFATAALYRYPQHRYRTCTIEVRSEKAIIGSLCCPPALCRRRVLRQSGGDLRPFGRL